MLMLLNNQGHAYSSMTSKEVRLSLVLQELNCSSTATKKVTLIKATDKKAKTRLRKVFMMQELAIFGTLEGIVSMKGQWCVWISRPANKALSNTSTTLLTTNTHSHNNQNYQMVVEIGGKDALIMVAMIGMYLYMSTKMKINNSSENHFSFS